MTPLVERLAELRRHLEHLKTLRPKVTSYKSLSSDLSLHNDVLFSLLMVCQAVIDISGELSAQNAERFEDYTDAVRNLARRREFPPELVTSLERLPGFRNVVVHDYVGIDLERVVEALNDLGAVEEFCDIVASIERERDPGAP